MARPLWLFSGGPLDRRLARADQGLAACAAAVEVLGLFPTAALLEAGAESGRYAEEMAKVVAAGLAMGAAAR